MIHNITIPLEIKTIVDKILNNVRLSTNDALKLWHKAPIQILSVLATEKKRDASQNKVFYNQNVHIEPTNICTFNCTFCSYKHNPKINTSTKWNLSIKDIENKMLDLLANEITRGITEVHIVGGVHPDHTIEYYCQAIKTVKKHMPNVTVKAYTAVELYHIITKANLTIEEGLKKLIDAGMGAIPGGGAEIFDQLIRNQICPDKPNAKQWIETHLIAHKLGLKTNATILYGHIESLDHRIDHLNQIRILQDKTNGFNAFIPLKYHNKNNELGQIVKTQTSVVEDMKMMALSRLFLDNVPHLKAYWPMMGKQNAALALNFGADDMDGTITDSTKIYAMAGAVEQKPTLTLIELNHFVKMAGFVAVERDTHYNEIKK